MNHRMHGGLVVLAFLTSASCGPSFQPYNEVDGFRLLAIKAEPPQIRPGVAVELSALVVGDEAPQFQWQWCAVTQGRREAHACALSVDDLPAALPAPTLGTVPEVALTWPEDPAAWATLCNLSAQASVPTEAPRLDCETLRPEIYIRLEVTASTGERIVALRPVPFDVPDRVPNANPQIASIRFRQGDAMVPLEEGQPLPTELALDLELSVPEATAETYIEDGEDVQEILRTTWFIDGGETDTQRTVFIPGDPQATFEKFRSNRWTLPTASTDAAIYLVIRDNRGGTSWMMRHMRIEGDAQ